LVLKFWIAMAAYVLLGTLAWSSLSDQNVRWVTLAILALLAGKTLTYQMRQRTAGEEDR
jgi:hypothetical protein